MNCFFATGAGSWLALFIEYVWSNMHGITLLKEIAQSTVINISDRIVYVLSRASGVGSSSQRTLRCLYTAGLTLEMMIYDGVSYLFWECICTSCPTLSKETTHSTVYHHLSQKSSCTKTDQSSLRSRYTVGCTVSSTCKSAGYCHQDWETEVATIIVQSDLDNPAPLVPGQFWAD